MKRRTFVWVLLVLGLLALLASPALAGDPARGTRADLSAPYVPGEVVIKFRPGTPESVQASVVRALGGRMKGEAFTLPGRPGAVGLQGRAAGPALRSGGSTAASVGGRGAPRGLARLGIRVAEFPALKGNRNPRAMARMLEALKKNPNVLYAEPNYIYRVTYVPNDPGLSQQWAWDTIQAYQAWDVTQGSSSVVVAVVDTGIQLDHPDLDAKIVAGYDFVDNDTYPYDGNGHGTHVAGTVAAETNNGLGGAGTCPNCRLMPVRVLDNNGSGTLTNVANGIIWAADNGAKVINLSLGGPGSQALQDAVTYAWNQGVFLACAAGNDGVSSTTNAYPAAYPECFAVAATDSADSKASFSNYGTWVEVAAPGVSIYSTWIGSGYNTINGTSMATPHVAGLAGLLASQGLTNGQIWDRICNTADAISGTGSFWSCGRINAYRAVTNDTGGGNTGGTNVLVNGDFEQGATGWGQSSSGGYQLITTDFPHTGNYGAWLGGYNNATDYIYQKVTVPAGGQLSYWWYMSTRETSSRSYDYFYVRLYNASGQYMTTLRTFSNASGEGVWRQDTLDLSAYAGQTLYIVFYVTTDSSYSTSFYVDDVVLK